MAQTKNYDDYQLGFDRTQLWKEYESPMIRRQTALNAAQSFFANNNIKYSAIDLKTLYIRFLNMIENGDTNFFEALDAHLEKKTLESVKFVPPTK
jgi:hypothetical protein